MEDEKEGSMEDEKDADAKKKDSSAEVLNNIITANANITETSDNSIVTFEDLPFIVPRGKYSCDLGPSSLRMHGATFNHILSYKNINRAFLLPKPDEVHMFFVFGLEKPMR
jgi:structure-specific recognition protein 1